MGKDVDLILHARVVVKSIIVQVIELKDILFQDGSLKRCGNVGFYKSSSLKSYKTLEILDKEYYVFVVNVFAYRYYLTISMRSIEIWVEIAKIYLILFFDNF